MGQLVSSFCFLVCGLAAAFVMAGGHFFLRKEGGGEGSSPLESGLATTGMVCSFFSLQFFTILVLFLILDLEVVLVVAFILSGSMGKFMSLWFVLFIMVSLWIEWEWGKLSWALLV